MPAWGSKKLHQPRWRAVAESATKLACRYAYPAEEHAGRLPSTNVTSPDGAPPDARTSSRHSAHRPVLAAHVDGAVGVIHHVRAVARRRRPGRSHHCSGRARSTPRPASSPAGHDRVLSARTRTPSISAPSVSARDSPVVRSPTRASPRWNRGTVSRVIAGRAPFSRPLARPRRRRRACPPPWRPRLAFVTYASCGIDDLVIRAVALPIAPTDVKGGDRHDPC